MFPQHAEATTGSAMRRAEEVLGEMAWSPTLHRLDHFETEPEYVEPLAASLREAVDDGAHILFSYHGLPLSHVSGPTPPVTLSEGGQLLCDRLFGQRHVLCAPLPHDHDGRG